MADVRRYGDALRRDAWIVLALMLLSAVLAAGITAALPRRYVAQASILEQVGSTPFNSPDVDAIERRLHTSQRLLTTPAMLELAAARLPGETAAGLEETVEAEVDPQANLLYVRAEAGDPRRAAARANAVATAYVDEQRGVVEGEYRELLDQLQAQLDRATDDPLAEDRALALVQRMAEVNAAASGTAADLRVAEAAEAPERTNSREPLRNALLALPFGLFVGLVLVLAREQLTPRVGSHRQGGRLLDVPVVGIVPRRPGRGRPGRATGAAEDDAYRVLAIRLDALVPPGPRPRVTLITSSVVGEGKSTATSRLGEALAVSGHDTLVIAADLRRPTLHRLLGVRPEPGLADLLDQIGLDPSVDADALLDAGIVPAGGGSRPARLDVLPAGRRRRDPAALLRPGALAALGEAVARRSYSHVLIDAPPLLGLPDVLGLASLADGVLVVLRLDRVTQEAVMDTRDLLDDLDVGVKAALVIEPSTSPYAKASSSRGLRRSVATG